MHRAKREITRGPRHGAGRPSTTSALLALALLAATSGHGRDGDRSGFSALERFFTGLPHRVEIVMPIAYAALDTGLATIDLSDPANPGVLGHVYLPSAATDVAIAGSHAFVADGESGLMVIDVADPGSPRLVGSLATAGARAVAVSGGIAYVGEAGAGSAPLQGLRVIDVSNPSAPLEVAFLPLANGVNDILVAGSTAWAALGSNTLGAAPQGLVAIDVSVPASPVPVPGGYLPTPHPVNQVAASAGVALLATGRTSSGSLLAVDVSAPAAPRILGSAQLDDGAFGVAVAGSTAWVAAGSLGLMAYGVANPAQPTWLGRLSPRGLTVGVAVGGGVALSAERSSNGIAALRSVDALSPASPRYLAELSQAEATAVAVDGGVACLLRRNSLELYDASNPAPAGQLGSWHPVQGDFSALDVRDGIAAVIEGDIVHLLDVTDPRNPREVEALQVSMGSAILPVLHGDRLYVVTGAGLEVFRLGGSLLPGNSELFPTAEWSSWLAVQGDLGYLVAGATLLVLDLKVPMSTVALGRLSVPGEQLYAVAADRSLAVATGLNALLYVFDVSNPAQPVLMGTLRGGTGFDVKLFEDRALVAAGENGIQLVDVSDPTRPRLAGGYDTSGRAVWLAHDEGLVMAATLEAQHWVLRCDACPACQESWPVVAAKSLRVTRQGNTQVLSWQLAGGTGGCNVHRTQDKRALPLLHRDGSTLLETTAARSLQDSYDPGLGPPALYRVYGAGSCSGSSYP